MSAEIEIVSDGDGALILGDENAIQDFSAQYGLSEEATSGLDQRTEASLYESLSRLGCAFVTITHRLETIRDFDEIVVLDEGIVVENGSFESLLEGGGLFSKMYFAYEESTKDGL